jgi:hypothetical protein
MTVLLYGSPMGDSTLHGLGLDEMPAFGDSTDAFAL